MAAVLWAGEGSAISHQPAAALWGLDGYRRVGVELTSPRNLRRGAVRARIHERLLSPEDGARVAGISVTSLERTLVDLAGVIRLPKLEETLDALLRRPRFSLDVLQARIALEPHNRPGLGRLRRLVAARTHRAGMSESVLETRLLSLLRRAGLPLPVQQHPVFAGAQLVARVDFAYPNQRVIIEADGYRYHSSRRAWQHDAHRHTELSLLGWRVLRFTWEDLKLRPGWVRARVAAALSVAPPSFSPAFRG